MSYYVTTPIYYVNAEPHLGHAYSTMAADVLARHMRQRGEDVFFLTGTDEHGEPIELAAEREGISPQELADRNAAKFEALLPIIDATNDFFIRTSDPRHTARVAEIMQRVYDNGWVDKGVYEGWYCPRCADFKTERELGPGNTCPIHEIPLEKVREENWFFRLSAFQERLEALYEEQPDFVVPDFRRNEAVAFIKGGLEDVSLSRPEPEVGAAAALGPRAADVRLVRRPAQLRHRAGFAREGEDLTERFWPANLHVMAKDILKFHAVIWPALCLAADLEPPQRMTIHGYLLMGEKKMSKSLGNVLDPFAVIERFGADALRFYLLPRGQLRPGRLDLHGRLRGPLRDRAGQRLRQPRQPGAGDGRALPRRHRAGGRGRRGARRGLRRGRRPLQRAARPGRADPGAGGGLEAGPPPQPLRRGDAAVGAGQGRGRPRAPRRSPLQPGRGPPGDDAAARPLPAAQAETLLAALGEEGRELAELGSRPGGQSVERIPPLFPKIED